jgi:DNA polymerase III subunit gamma/tau
MNLALKHRPRDFSEVVGQKAPSVILAAMVAKNSLSRVLLFTGPSGVGKTSMARIVAAALNPESRDDVHNRTHPYVLEIDGASNGSVAAIRDLKRSLNYASYGNKVIIIDEAHSMSDEAFDVFKDMLENVPEGITYILCTTEEHRLEPAIRHRCDRYRFKKASVEDLFERLSYVNSQEGTEVTPELLNLIAQRSEGSYRESLMILEQVAAGGIKTVDEYNNLQGEVDYGPTLIRSAMHGPVDAVNQLETILRYTNTEEVVDRTIETLKDIMILKGGIKLTFTGISLESRLELASKIDTGSILKAMKIIWDLQTKLNAGDPVRSLELAYSLIGEILEIKDLSPISTNTAPLSLDEMRRRQQS